VSSGAPFAQIAELPLIKKPQAAYPSSENVFSDYLSRTSFAEKDLPSSALRSSSDLRGIRIIANMIPFSLETRCVHVSFDQLDQILPRRRFLNPAVPAASNETLRTVCLQIDYIRHGRA